MAKNIYDFIYNPRPATPEDNAILLFVLSVMILPFALFLFIASTYSIILKIFGG